ncbi:tRNA (adenosine(37)-N6)-dimethylallyltransferase MiaA [Geotalea toluenoxydans]|uniref:tRNA (adenosine(37)-N6)-dimethylallyltransferase MiaA n=1 Tax=Geotalea toluenoxydans TaxID=421624 RepID=UPI0006D19798|nr:tRNA (adenosine(37)-N6)-dimethylallyltransferase MiaA [Geotalea toluenoxydans]
MKSEEKIKLVSIVGPTASGKTELAVRLAERFDGEIVNADSMQVYRDMDIGTAKPSADLSSRVPHHLMDIVTPDVNFSASDFRRHAVAAIADIHSRGKRVFIVGGTGLYIRALLQGLVDSPSGDEQIRGELNELAKEIGNEGLLQLLAEVDPITAERLHPNDRVRIIRALEVYRQTGRPMSQFRQEHGFAEQMYDCLMLGINVERQELYSRVEKRVDEMIASGLAVEVEELFRLGYARDLKAMRSIGYKEICSFLKGEISLDQAVQLIKRDTRRYAKRQMTWFNKEYGIKWVEYPAAFANICNHVIEFFERGEDHAKSTFQHPGSVP